MCDIEMIVTVTLIQLYKQRQTFQLHTFIERYIF